jgi:hypothetical protein
VSPGTSGLPPTYRHECISRAGACLLGEPQRKSRRSRRHTVHCAQHDLSLFVAVAQQVLRNGSGQCPGLHDRGRRFRSTRRNGTGQERKLRVLGAPLFEPRGYGDLNLVPEDREAMESVQWGIVSLGYGAGRFPSIRTMVKPAKRQSTDSNDSCPRPLICERLVAPSEVY